MSGQSFTINAGITDIDYPTANALIESGQCTLLDVREDDELSEGFIPSSIHLSLDRIDAQSMKEVSPNVARPVIVYCKTGKRAQEAAIKLKRMGYYYILNMGGISSWPFAIEYPA